MSNRVMSAEDALQKANSLFVDENFDEALNFYNLALELDDKIAESFVKRSICYYKLDKFAESVGDANSAIKIEPTNGRAYLRKGMALFSLEEYETAKIAFEKGLQYDTNNSQLKTWLRKCDAELEAEGITTTSTTSTTTTTSNNSTNTQTTNTPTTNTTTTNTTTNTVSPVTTTDTNTNKVRYEWYQTNTHVTVSVFIKNALKEKTTIEYEEKTLSVTSKLDDTHEYNLELDLYDSIDTTQCNAMFLSTKIEIKMKKKNGIQWKTLEDTGNKTSNVSQFTPTTTTTTTTTAKKTGKNWDKIVDEVVKTEGPLDNEDSLNKVFQDIYGNGTEEQRRAMMKSFVESGGTVLSTNWDEVGKGEVKGSPPDGMTMHKWNE